MDGEVREGGNGVDWESWRDSDWWEGERQEVSETVLSLEYVLLCNKITSNLHNFETICLTMVLNKL